MKPGAAATHAMIDGPAPGRLLVAVFDDGTLVAWNVAEPYRPRLLRAHAFGGRIGAIALSSTNSEVAIVSEKGSVSLWDPIGGSVRVLPGTVPEVKALAYSHDGGTLTAFGRTDKGSRLMAWDLRSGQQRSEWIMDERDKFTLSLRGHILDSKLVSISPDGTVLALADDTTVALWDLESRTLIAAFTLPDRAESLVFVAGGSYLLAPHFRGVSRLQVGARRLLALACEIAGRSLTSAEQRQFFGDANPPSTCVSGLPAAESAAAPAPR
jgi:WD40 repeat protein